MLKVVFHNPGVSLVRYLKFKNINEYNEFIYESMRKSNEKEHIEPIHCFASREIDGKLMPYTFTLQGWSAVEVIGEIKGK